MNKSVCFVTDTGTDLPLKLTNLPLKIKDIFKVPLHFIFDDRNPEDENMTDAEFDRICLTKLPTTSGPSEGEYAMAYEEAADAGFSNILCLPISSRLSASYNTAKLATLDFNRFSNLRIEVVDTRSISLGIGYLIETLVEMMADPGITFNELVRAAYDFHNREQLYLALDSLDSLERLGRASRIQKELASILKIKPIITLSNEGDLKVLDKVRTFSKALDWVIEKVSQTPNIKKLGVMYSDNRDIATSFAILLVRALREKGVLLKISDVPVVQVCRPIRLHAGGNAVGACVVV